MNGRVGAPNKEVLPRILGYAGARAAAALALGPGSVDETTVLWALLCDLEAQRRLQAQLVGDLAALDDGRPSDARAASFGAPSSGSGGASSSMPSPSMPSSSMPPPTWPAHLPAAPRVPPPPKDGAAPSATAHRAAKLAHNADMQRRHRQRVKDRAKDLGDRIAALELRCASLGGVHADARQLASLEAMATRGAFVPHDHTRVDPPGAAAAFEADMAALSRDYGAHHSLWITALAAETTAIAHGAAVPTAAERHHLLAGLTGIFARLHAASASPHAPGSVALSALVSDPDGGEATGGYGAAWPRLVAAFGTLVPPVEEAQARQMLAKQRASRAWLAAVYAARSRVAPCVATGLDDLLRVTVGVCDATPGPPSWSPCLRSCALADAADELAATLAEETEERVHAALALFFGVHPLQHLGLLVAVGPRALPNVDSVGASLVGAIAAGGLPFACDVADLLPPPGDRGAYDFRAGHGE